MKYSFPYTPGTLHYLQHSKYKDHVHDIYFSDDNVFPSARHSSLTKNNWDEIIEIKNTLNIPLNYVINPSVYDYNIYYGESKKALASRIKLLKTLSVSIITFNNTMLMNDPIIKEALKDYDVKNSVNNRITTLEQVSELVNKIGLKNIILGKDINQNLNEIIRIRNKFPNIKLNLLANETCTHNCVYKQFCDDLICTASQAGDELFNKLNLYRVTVACDLQNFSIFQKLTNNMIFPNQIKHYAPYIDVIKISGRLQPLNNIINTFENYVNEKTIDIDNFKIPLEYYTKTLNCKNKCESCKYCEKITKI